MCNVKYPTEMYCIVHQQSGEIVSQHEEFENADSALKIANLLSSEHVLKIRSADGLVLYKAMVITSDIDIPMSILSHAALTFVQAWDGTLESFTQHHEVWQINTIDVQMKVWHNPTSDFELAQIQAELRNKESYILVVTNRQDMINRLSKLGSGETADVSTLTSLSGLKFTLSEMQV